MANKKNVETNKKNTEIKNKKSNEIEQKKPTQKKKRRLHSHLKVNIPLFQSLMMILPSLAKHAAAESIDNSSDAADQVTANNVTEKDVTDDHSKADSSAVALQEAQTSDSDVNSTLNASHAPHGSSSHLVPSHHLSTLSHPQVHYIPSVSMPTISSGSNGQPTHSNAPKTPALPVTFMPEVIKGTYGELHVDANGQYTFVLNPNSPQYILLNQHQPGTDHFALHLSNGSSIIVQIPVTGKQDTPSISGDLTGVVTEDHNIDSQGLLHANGKIDVIDPDQNESSVTPEVISGKYGSLTIDADGHWQYQVDNSLSNVQALTAATSLHESFTIHTKDGTPQTIDMTIGGNDDNAVITGMGKGSVTEESQLQTSGTLSVIDADTGEAHFSNTDIVGSFGTLHLTDSGKWTYDLDNTNPAVQALGQGSTATDPFTVHSADGTPHNVTINVRGTNDNPVVSSQSPHLPSKANISAPPSGLGKTIYEDVNVQNGHLHTGGQLHVDDKDFNESTFLPENLHGAYGELKLTSQGTWSYIANNNNPNIEQLNNGDTLTERFKIHTKDGSVFELNVYINGTNDKATVSTATVSIDETDRAVTASGTLTSTDVDNADNTFTPNSISGTNGDLTIDANGHWSFTANSAFNQLNVGDKVEETFTVSSVDGTPSTIKVTINGTNDKATVSSATVTIDETDKAVTTSGTLTSTDVDNPDNTFTPGSISGTNGDLTIDANGHWTFTANSTFNQLNVGDKVEETFTVSSIDGTTSTIKVTLNGTNDKATVSSATVAIDEIDKAVTTSGTLTSTDVDNPNNTFTPDSISGTNGDLTIDANGHWAFAANSAFNQLNVGDKVEESFTVSSVDGTPSTIKVTINGTNDAATVSSATVAIDETDTAISTSGTLTSTDVDNPDNAFTPDSITGTNGDLTIDANGHWAFTANSAFNQLNVGDKVEETFTVSSIDGTPSTIKVTINGTNDAATVSTATVAVDETDTAISTSGTLTSTNVDNPDNAFTPDSITGTNGDLTIDANGHWNFTANSAFNQLNVGDKIEETFTVSSIDGTTSTIKVMINGTNDTATVSTATVSVDETDSAITTSGTLTSTDVDNPDNTFTPDSIAGTNGDLTIDANGLWSFTANSAFNQLNVGDKVEETFTVSSVDGTTSTIKVTINGTNDAATVSSATVAIDETDKATTTSGTLTSTDVDNPDNAFTPDSISGTNGDLTIDATGHWVFTANSAFNQLNIGDKVEETFTVSSIDGTPSTIKVTINGTNDTATVSSATVAIDETDKAVTTSGTLTSIDVDNPDNAFTPDSISGTNGDLTIDANGHWVFTANSAFNQLNVGDKVEETFTVSSVDGTPSTIKVTINGTNDTATVSSATVAIDETDIAVTTSGTLTSTDVDNPDNAFTPDSIAGTNGNLTIDTNGHWTFTANSAFNQLNVGDKVEETFTVSSIDGTPSTIKVTINGTNDAATVSTATVSVDETDKAVTTSGTLTSTDVDNPDNTFAPDSISGTNGDLTIDATGHWVFIANSAFNQLNVGDKVEETFTVSSIDGTPSTIKVTINGTNDAATVSSATVAIDETDKAVTTSGTLTSTDVDNPDNAFQPDSISGTNGDLIIDASGHWMFTANSAFNQLNVGDKVEETFTMSSVDGTPSTIKVTINGTNDTATVSSATVAIDETDKAVTTSGTLTSIDVDNPDNAFTPDSISGTNGDLTIDATGHWVFIANSAFNQLNVGDKVEETFTVSSIDGTPSTIKVTINGTNDAATVSSATVAIDETDKAVTTSGTLTSTDVDNPDNTFTPDSIGGTNGNLTIDANGHWIFTANSAFNQLNIGDKVEESFTVSSVDGTPSTIKVMINGTNDTATVSSATVAIDETDKAVTTSGTLTSTDVDNPDNTFTPDSISGTNGDLTIDANGHWAFTANSAFNQLNVGDKVEETFTVSSVDGTPSTIKVTINGTNDAATVSSATVAIDETDKAVTTSGTLTSTDVDNPDNTFTPDSISGTNGDLTIDANGHWVFTASSSFNQLNVGDKVEETFTVSSIDGTASTIKVTINGTNDKATVSTATVSVDETDKAVTTSGTLTSTDVDNPDNTFTPDSITGTNGNLTIGANGQWTFTPNSAFNQLNVGDKVEETFTVTSVDGTPSTIKVTINGTNDAATVSSATIAIDETDKAVTTSGTLTSTDVDNPDNTFTPDSIAGTNGNLTIGANGQWTFTANSAFNQLNVGDKVEETFTVSSVDGTPSTIKVTINGTNDKATVSSATVAIDETDKAVTTSGTLISNDVDNPDNAFTPDSISGTNGDLTIDANGHWVFTANSAFNQLNVGDKVEETFTVSSIDGTPSTIKVTINGTNDAATVSSATVAIDETDKAVTTSGTLTSTDVDNPDNAFTPDSISGTNGDLTIDANGHWTFTANSAFNQLNVGDKVEETFTVSSVDGTPSTIKVTINGTNDAATVSSATVAIDETDKATTTSGTLTSTDVDNPDNTFTPDSITGANGDLTIDANGHWAFTANSAFNQLNVGDKVEETFTVSSVDGTSSTIKVTINGTNDVATVSTATVSVDETDKAVTTSGTLTSTDVDNPDNTFTPDSIVGANGDLTIDANGHWVFTANSAFNQLNVGDKVEETFTVTSVDGTPSTIKVTINGTNDAATVSSATVAIDETDKAVTTSGTLTSTDVDNTDNTFTPDSVVGSNGDLTIDANGHWTFTANSAFNQLNVGDKVEETFTVSSIDGTPSTIKVTINGTNDAATVSSATVAIDETDKAVTTSGTLTNTDVDNPDNTFTPDSISGTNGDLTIDTNGHWVFTANSTFNQLNVGDKVEETFTVSSIDGTPSTIKITINGTNDKAVISGTSAGAVTEESQLQTSGSLTVTDVDAGQGHFSNTDIAGTLGTLHLTNSGTWTYDLDNTNPTVQALGKGTTATDTITVHSADGTPHQITITVNGTNDKAIIGGTNSGAVTEESQLQTSGTLTVTDVDTGEAHFSNTDIAGTLGTLHLTDNGTWTYDLDNTNPQVQALGKGATATDTITVNSADGTPHQITITVNGTNDTAVIGGTSAGAVTEETQLQTSGSLTITDTDTGEAHFSNTDIKGSLGTLHLTDAGQWTYDLDNTNPTVQALGKGAATTDTITVTSADGTTHQVTIAVNGTNDKAIITGTNTGAVTEDQDLTNQLNVHPNYMLTQGKLFITDVDTNEATFPMQSGIVGDHGIGSFTLIPSGIWLFSADSKQAAVQALGVGETLTESTTITSVDGTQKTILITINGTNDAPVITPVATQTVTEDGSKTITFHATDIDTTDTLTPSVSATHGSASLNAQGEIVFTPDANYNGPASVVLSVTDGHTTTSQTINVDVTPANDAPVINPIVPVSATEDGAVVTGQLTSTDIDTGDTATFTTTSTQGGFTLNADGSYNLDPTDASFQHLKAGEISTFTIPVTVTDSAGATDTKDLVITVTGTNDTPVISGVDTGALKEDVSVNPQSNELTATGKLDIVDIDTGEGSFISHGFNKTALQGHYGKLEISQDGSWSYSADNSQTAIQSLGEGEQLTDTIKVTSKDGTTHDVVVTINGTNDTAVIGGTSAGAVTEETQLQTSGTLTVTDTDTGEAHFANTDIQGTLGTLHLTDNGAWTYDLDNTNPAVQALGNGATATDTITVHSADGTPHQVTITVNGTNDNAVVGGVDTASVTEKAAGDNMSPDHAQSGMATLRVSTLNANGHLSVIDPDSGQSGFADNNVGYNYHGTYGDLILNPNGDWNYYADAGSLSHIGGRPTTRGSAIDKLGEGETLTDTITVHTKDGTPHNIVITINGSNDRPYCSSEVQLNAGTEDTRQTITAAQLLQNSIDVDKNDSGLLTVANLHPDHGSILDNQNGTYTFTPEKDYNGKVHFTYDVKDAHGDVTHTGATSSLSAVADKAVISGSDTGTIIEDHNVGHSSLQPVVASGLLSVTDPDAGQDHFQVNLLLGEQAIHDPFGGFLRITPSGAWGYEVANSRLQSLAEGEVEKVVYRVYSADHTAHDITITVTGTNDQPSITATTLAHGTEDTHYQMQVSQFGFSDIDTGDTLHSIAITDLPSATQGKFVLDGHDVTAGQHIPTADISKLQFIPAQDFNGDVQFKYTVNDGHDDSQEATNTLHIDAVGDKAVISGVDTGDVYENRNPDMSPDFAQSGMAHLTNSMIHVEGQLTIIDPDTGENSFDSKGIGYTYHGKYGHLILNTDGKWFYGVATGTADVNGGLTTNVGSTIDQLGANETLTDTITIQSKDGTTHDIVITIHGDNDRPYCSSEVQLNSGKEDLAQTITATELLANTIDVDSNDLGKLTVANLHADHGSILDNQDGTYTFTPTKDYNGQIHFSYDVTDAHGGTTHTGASTTLTATPDGAIISEVTTDHVTEDGSHSSHNAGVTTELANGRLQVVDPDSGENKFQYSQFGESTVHDPFGGMLRIDSMGNWGYSVNNANLQHLAQGQTETVIYRVHSYDGTAYELHIDVVGTNDAPTVTQVALSNGTEDTHYQMQASQFGFTDVDSGDTLHSVAITDLPPATQGKFVLDGHDVTAGQHIPTADISKLQFVPAQDFNGDVQFKYTVNDGHDDSQEATNTLHIDAVGDTAVITGTTTGDVDEGHGTYHDRSPNYAQLGMAKLTNDPLYTDGKLEIIDPDTGEAQFDTKGIGYSYHGTYGQLILNADGNWHYKVTVGSNQQNVATKIDQLGDGQELTDTITIYSKDGTAQDIVITIHGDNDRPYISSEVTLSTGTEDTALTFTKADLLANTVDVDANDAGKLSIANLLVDHGSVVDNKDGTYTFTPTKDYNGQVHFSYDVTDAHGGTTHTGANTSLAAVNDAATFTGDSSSIKEDTNIHHNAHITGSATIPDALSCHGHLIVSDADGHGEAALDLKGQPKISLDGTYGHFDITSTGTWVYKADNKSTPIQDLDNGQTLTDSIEVTSKDGTKHSITVTINGTTDDPTLHSLSDSGVQHSGPVEGNLLTGSGTDQGLSGAATDTDSNAHLVLQDIQIKDPVSGYVAVRPGQPHTMAGIGTLAIEANGHYTFTPEAGFTGKVPSMVYRVGDDGGNPIGDSSQNSLSIEVTPPLQHAPTVTGQTVSTNEDITRTITTSEFGYSDQDGDALQFVTISSIPSHGSLLLNGNAVTANQQISKADLDAGHLTFTPNNNENGANYAQFTFTANDGHKNSAGATMVVDVNAVNDAPIVGSSFISSLEDKPHAFTTADFKYSDIDGDALNHITITNVAHGVLSLNGTTVNVGDDVSASDVSSLIFTPTHNYFSSGVSGLGAVQFTANDGHLDSKEGSILINIASVADPATFSGDSTGVAKEDITLQASGTLTASDPDGTAGFTAVQGGAGIAGSKGYGHAHIDVNGHWTYDLDNNHPIVQQLGEGQTDTETITVQSADGTHHDIVVTITGTNDAPILGVNQTSSTAGTLTETDVDVNDTHTFSIVSSTGQFGSLSVDPNTGDYIYTPNTSITGMSYNSATNSYHGVDVFEVKVSDGHTEDSKFITFDASGHVTMSPTGSLVTSTTVLHQPVVTTTQPTLPSGTNVAPTNTVTLDLASTSDSGSSQTDNLTNDTTPTITGHTDIPFSKVTIYDGSTPVGHSVSDASGQYSVAVSSLSEGDHNLSAKALAPSSVLPATSSLLSVHIDTQVHVGIQTDPITADNVINAQESNSSIDITGSVSGDYNAGDIVTLDVNRTQHTGVVDAKGHYSIAVPGSELIADADQKIEASVAVTDTAGNSAHATADVTYQVDTQVSVPTITFENAGADNLYSKAEIARGQANTITATVTPPGDAKIGEHLVVNGQDHVLDAHTLQHGIQIEVHPGSNVQATMTDEHGNTAGSQGFAASAIPEPIIVRPPSGSHQVSGTLGVPPLLPSLTPVPTAQSGWRIHLPNGQYVTSHHGQYGTLTIDPQTGHLHYQEQAQVHTGPHGSASGIGQHEDKFEVALQGSNQDEVVAHVNIQILSHGPGNSGKLTVGTEVVDMTITPLVHTSHPAPPPPPPVQHDEPDMASQADFTVTLSDDSNLDLTQQTHQEPDQKTSHHGAAAYLDALGIKPDATSTTVHDQPADMDIVLAQVDQQDATTHDQAHLDMSDALEHHDANINHNQDDEHHHNDIDGLPDIDPNS
ncbi:VCBS domain-containing protein [Vibrio splendidus]|uniref:VCBS domain-containing protein n=1 Tax=Vibrio splendidus TaxID=29497 RepID=UPI00352D9957